MSLNEIGLIVKEEWLKTQEIRKEIRLDEFAVMPNHIHGIVVIKPQPTTVSVGTHGRASLQRMPKSLGSLVAGFKSAATKRINEMRDTLGEAVWQARFHDRIIRNEAELHCIRQYIQENPIHWDEDEENHKKQSKF